MMSVGAHQLQLITRQEHCPLKGNQQNRDTLLLVVAARRKQTNEIVSFQVLNSGFKPKHSCDLDSDPNQNKNIQILNINTDYKKQRERERQKDRQTQRPLADHTPVDQWDD